MKLDKILIIDGSNLLHRQLNQSDLDDLTYNGKKTGAVYGFFRSLLVSVKRYPDHYPIIVFDKGKSPRRLAIYPNYKHTEDNRKEREELKSKVESGLIPKEQLVNEYLQELFRQGDIIRELLASFKIPVIMMSHWEGDDLMAILSRVVKDGVIVTDDRDMYQLANDHIKIFRPIRIDNEGNRGVEVLYNDVADPKYGIREFVIIKSIVGDGSDNIPKVAEGLGNKHAKEVADIILDSNEDPLVYLDKIKTIGKKYSNNFVEHFVEYKRNLYLVDLSLVPYDPIVLEELNNQLMKLDGQVQLLDVVKSLSRQGITRFDYTKLIECLYRSRSQVYD